MRKHHPLSRALLALAAALPLICAPARPAAAQAFLIHEVATSESAGDWVELLCIDDGAGGAGCSLAGWTLTNLSSVQKTFGATTVRTGEFVVLLYASDGVDDTAATGGVATVHTANSGLTATSDQLALRRPDGSYADAFCWANASISSTQKSHVTTLVNAGQWVDEPPIGGGFEDCADSAAMKEGRSYARYAGAPDTNGRNDFAIANTPTRGAANAPAPVVAAFTVSGLPVYAVSGAAYPVRITAVDAGGQAVANYAGSPTLSLTAGQVAPAAVAVRFLSGAATVDLTFTGSGMTRLTVTAGGVSSTSDLFHLAASPPAPSLLINEIACDGGGGGFAQDWIELHCVYDGTNGAGFDLASYTLADDAVFHTFARGTLLRTGDHLLVLLGADAERAMTLENGLLVVRSTKAGLTATDEQVVLGDPDGRVVDAVMWARHTRPDTQTIPASELADMQRILDALEWEDLPPAGAQPTDAFDANRVQTGYSLARDRFSTDANKATDFILSAAPTPGRRNVEAGVADRLAFTAASPLVAYTRRETAVTLEARDVYGQPVAANATVVVASGDARLEFSLDGGNTFRTQGAAILRNGTLGVILRGSLPVVASLSASDPAGMLAPADLRVDLRRYPYLVVSEIMYNPPEAKESDAEFVEIANYGEAPVDLAGFTLEAGGRTLAFPAPTILPVGGHLVACPSRAGFEKKYGDGSGVFGDAAGEDFPLFELGFSLSNTEDTITLRSPDGLYSTAVTYQSKWGGANDGRSLEKIDPDVVDTGDAALDAFNWTGSAAAGGSPGRANGAVAEVRPPLEIVHTFVRDLAANAPATSVDFTFEPAVDLESATLYFRRQGDAAFSVAPMTFDGESKWAATLAGETFLGIMGSTLEYYFYGVGGETTVRDPAAGTRTRTVKSFLTVPGDLPLELSALVNGATAVTLKFRETGAAAWSDFPMSNILGTSIWKYRVDPFLLSRNGIEYHLVATDGTRTTRFPATRDAIALQVVDVVPKLRLLVSQDRAAKEAVFSCALRVENAAGARSVRAVIGFPKELFTPLDDDAARPGVNAARGDFLAAGHAEVNAADAKNGTFEIALVSDVGSGEAAGTAATLRLKAKADAVGAFALDFRTALVDGSERVDAYGATVALDALTAQATIGPEGGTLSGPGDFRVTIPAGALPAPAAFTIELVSAGLPALADPALGEGFDRAWLVTPEVAGLTAPATVEIPWSGDETKGRNEKTIVVLRFDQAEAVAARAPGRAPAFGAGFYRPVALTARDASGNRAVALTPKFGLFRLAFAPPAAGRIAIGRFLAAPNPFSPNGDGKSDTTFFVFDLSRDAECTLRLFDVRGREVRRLLDGAKLFAGEAKAPWDGRDDTGGVVPTGVYIAKLSASDDGGGVAKRHATVTVSPRMRE